MPLNFKNIPANLKWFMFLVSATGGFLALLDSSTINIALSEIAKEFNAPITSLQWVVTSYILVLSTFLTLFGKLNDIVNRKHLYATGYALFALGSLLNFLSTGLLTLIGSRIVQAIGASILVSNNIAIISSIFKGKKRTKALGIMGAILALAGMMGPVVGGFLMQYFGWRAIFLPSFTVAVFGAYFSLKLIPSLKRKKKFKFDYLGMAYLLVATFSLLLSMAEGHNWGWLSKKVILLYILFVTFSTLFYKREIVIANPIIDFKLFESKAFLFGNFALLFSYFAMFANVILFPFYARTVLDLNPLHTAMYMIPFSILFLFAALVGSKLVNKFGSEKMMIIGGVFIALGLTSFMFCGASICPLFIILAQALMGLGSGLYQPSVNVLIMSSVPFSNVGIASGILALFRHSGMLFGTMISVSVFEFARSRAFAAGMSDILSFVNGYHKAICVGIFFAIVCVILSYRAFEAKTQS